MATARLILCENWSAGLYDDDPMYEAINKVGKRAPDGSAFVEADVLAPVPSMIEDSRVLMATYQGNRDVLWIRHDLPDYGLTSGGVTVQFPQASEEGKQCLRVRGAPHSLVRSVFFRLWEGKLKVADLGKEEVPSDGSLKRRLQAPERETIRATLELNKGNRKKTAVVLGINRTTLFNKMRKYGLLGVPAATK